MEVISNRYFKKYCIGEISPENLETIFLKTAKMLTEDREKYEFLVYPERPREHEIKKVMIDILSKIGFYHMIERPINIPGEPGKKDPTGLVDISVYTKKGMLDIELKESIAKRNKRDKLDFPKILSSNSYGCSVFYFFRGKNIDKQLDKIVNRYQNIYDDVRDDYRKRNLIKKKWFLFFLFSYQKSRVFSVLYNNIQKINFDLVRNNEKELIY